MILSEKITGAWKKKIASLSLEEMRLIYDHAQVDFEVFRNYELWLTFVMRLSRLEAGAIAQNATGAMAQNTTPIDSFALDNLSDLLARPSLD